MFKNEEGFSLLELVVAVGVAGIIAAVTLPTFAGLQDKATTTSATYAASASAAEALANSTLGTTGGTNSSSSQETVTITGLSIMGYNNYNVIWTAATASNGEPVIYTVFATSNSAEIMQPTSSSLATLVAPWSFPSGTTTLLYDEANGTYAFSRLELGGADHWNDITIVASIASNPSVVQTAINN